MGSDMVARSLAWSLDLCTSVLHASIVSVNWMGHAVLGPWLVCAFLAELMSPTFSAGIVASLTACLITGSNHRHPTWFQEFAWGSMGQSNIESVLKEDALALHKHHKSLKGNTLCVNT